MEHNTTSISLMAPGKGRVLSAFGDTVTFLVDGARSGGTFTQFVSSVMPGVGPPPHRHANEDEAFYVLSGKVAFFNGETGAWTEAGPGASAFMPRNSLHTFRAVGDEPASLLVTTTPAGFETFFSRCAALFAEPGPPDMARIMAIAAEHGIEFAPPGG